jgi:hypothetical protein
MIQLAFPNFRPESNQRCDTPKHAGNSAWEGGDFHISETISSKRMRSNRRIRSSRKSKASGDFRISEGPVVSAAVTALGAEEIDLPKLPRVYESPWLFAIARDPDTIFAYWNVDWPAVFSADVPEDRQVHARVLRCDGAEETAVAAEPMAANIYITVSPKRGPYHMELGYYGAGNVWRPVALSDEIEMPPDSISETADVDLATIPFHLSFQRMIDLFRVTNRDALATAIGRLQRRIASDHDPGSLSDEEEEILSEMNLTLDELRTGWRNCALAEKSGASRKRAEAILGLGGSSAARPFGGGS